MKVTTCGVQAPAYDTLLTPTTVSTRCATRSTRPRPTRSPLSLPLSPSSAALPTPPPRRSVSPRTSPSLRSSARTRLRTSASTLPSSSMPPTPPEGDHHRRAKLRADHPHPRHPGLQAAAPQGCCPRRASCPPRHSPRCPPRCPRPPRPCVPRQIDEPFVL